MVKEVLLFLDYQQSGKGEEAVEQQKFESEMIAGPDGHIDFEDIA